MKRVFIVGCPRSGTTLLQTLLAANGGLVSPPETHFFNHLVPRSFVRRLGVASRSGRDRIIGHMKKAGLEFQAPKSCWISDWSKALVECLDDLALAASANGWIEKTPVHLHFLELIEKLVPDAQFVHIVRNGKDTCASLYEAANRYPEAWGGKRSAAECAERWAQDVVLSRARSRDPRHKIVRYEKLVAHPRATITELLQFMHVQRRPNHDTVLNDRSIFDKAVLEDEPWKKFKVDLYSSKDKFEAVFSIKERLLVNAIVSGVSLPE